jgi:hypothetical protein
MNAFIPIILLPQESCRPLAKLCTKDKKETFGPSNAIREDGSDRRIPRTKAESIKLMSNA